MKERCIHELLECVSGAVSIGQQQRSRERLQCRLRHYMHFLSPAKHSGAAWRLQYANCVTAVCTASCMRTVKTAWKPVPPPSVATQAESLKSGPAVSLSATRTALFAGCPVRSVAANRVSVATLASAALYRRQSRSAVHFGKCMHALGALCPPRATKCSLSRPIRSLLPRPTPPRRRQMRRGGRSG
jgi:hypothetical protein